MPEVKMNVQVFHNLAVEGEEHTVTRVVALAECGSDVLCSEEYLVDQAVEKLEGFTREDVIAATKREVLRELTVNLVANGVL